MLFRYLLTMVLSALYLYATNIKEFNLLDSHYIKDEKIVILNFNESVDIKSAKSSIKLIKKEMVIDFDEWQTAGKEFALKFL